VAKHNVSQATTIAAFDLTLLLHLQDVARLKKTIGSYRKSNINFGQLCVNLCESGSFTIVVLNLSSIKTQCFCESVSRFSGGLMHTPRF